MSPFQGGFLWPLNLKQLSSVILYYGSGSPMLLSLLGPVSKVSDWKVLREAWEFVFLMSSQETLILLIQRPNFENNYSISLLALFFLQKTSGSCICIYLLVYCLFPPHEIKFKKSRNLVCYVHYYTLGLGVCVTCDRSSVTIYWVQTWIHVNTWLEA